MFASKTNLITTLATVAGLLMASAAVAKNGNGSNLTSLKGNKAPAGGTSILTDPSHVDQLSGDKNGGFKITHGGNPPRSPESFHKKNKYWYWDHSRHIVFVDHFVESAFVSYVVLPGDTLETISFRLFNTRRNAILLAELNHLPTHTILIPGQVILVPAF